MLPYKSQSEIVISAESDWCNNFFSFLRALELR